MKPIKYIALVCCGIAFGATGYSCTKGNEKDDKPVLTVSLEPQRYLLEQIVGDNFKVVSLMPNGDNPEMFDPSPARRIDVENSLAYFTIGHLPFEDNLKLTAKDTTIFVTTTVGIEPIYGTHSHDSNHSTFLPSGIEEIIDADPHMWTSVRNARVMSRIMVERVVKLDPAHADEYAERYEKFDAHLDSLDRAFAARLDSLPNKAFLVWHPSLSYFARDYGMEQLAVGHESKEMSINALRSVISEAKADSVRVFFYQRDYDSRQAEAISSSIGARLVPVNPGSYEWEKELNTIVDELAKP